MTKRAAEGRRRIWRGLAWLLFVLSFGYFILGRLGAYFNEMVFHIPSTLNDESHYAFGVLAMAVAILVWLEITETKPPETPPDAPSDHGRRDKKDGAQ